MLTTTALACNCKKIVSPAMNTQMYDNPITQDNIKKLKDYGFEVIDPTVGMLACGDVGAGKMPEPEVLLDYILKTRKELNLSQKHSSISRSKLLYKEIYL